MRMLGIPASVNFAQRYDWDEIGQAYRAGSSMTDCMKRFGFSRNAWWDAIRRGAIDPRPRLEPLDAILIAGRRRSRHHVKNRLLLAGLKEQRCEHCGLTAWQGRPLPLELHHVNGDGLDNRLENLLLLCPNCHSQTDTWGGRNKSRGLASRPLRRDVAKKACGHAPPTKPAARFARSRRLGRSHRVRTAAAGSGRPARRRSRPPDRTVRRPVA